MFAQSMTETNWENFNKGHWSANPHEKRTRYATAFIPSIPQVGQDERFFDQYGKCRIFGFIKIPDMPASCCYVGTSIAAACRALRNKDQPYLDLKLSADFDIYVNGTFFISLTYHQSWLSLAFGDEITAGFGKDGFFRCSEFTYIH